MLQPYRTDANRRPLSQAPGCDEAATSQTVRHATQAEYDAIPAGLIPTDAIAHMRVDACDDHADTPPFAAPAPEPGAQAACPKCGATGEQPCKKTDGTARGSWHRARYDAQPATPSATHHAHREDCGIFTGCQCTAADAPPQRQARVPGVTDRANTAKLKIPTRAAMLLLENRDIPWASVRSVRSVLTQDNQPAIRAEYVPLDNDGQPVTDQHGHEQVQTIIVPLDPMRPAQHR